MKIAEVYIHETSVVESKTIGPGSKIWHFSHVRAGAEIGKNCVLGQNTYVAPTVVIGDGCKIQNNVSIYDGVTLGQNVFVGPSVVFTNVTTPRAHVDRSDAFEETVVKTGASIGANATILAGNIIGEYALVGAGAVVTSDVPDFACVVGNPARQIGMVCTCGELLNDGSCDRCSNA